MARAQPSGGRAKIARLACEGLARGLHGVVLKDESDEIPQCLSAA
jgi:hypothetical protein